MTVGSAKRLRYLRLQAHIDALIDSTAGSIAVNFQIVHLQNFGSLLTFFNDEVLKVSLLLILSLAKFLKRCIECIDLELEFISAAYQLNQHFV